MRHTILIATTTLLAAGVFVLFGGALRESSPPEPRRSGRARRAAFDPAFSSARNAGSLVLRLQQQIRQNPDDAASYALLGLAYEQSARETGDSAYYPRAETVLRRAIELDEGNAVAFSGLASLALSRHRFGEALVLARRARALAPTEARTLGAIGDALVELGRYREAFATFDKLARLKPGLAAYARSLVRARVARRSSRRHRRHAAGSRDRRTRVRSGGLDGAAAREALQFGRRPDERREAVPYRARPCPRVRSRFRRPRFGRGRSEAAVPGHLPRRRAVAAVPLPQYVANLGDLLQRAAARERPPGCISSSSPSIACSGRAASTPISSWLCSASTTTAGWRRPRARHWPRTTPGRRSTQPTSRRGASPAAGDASRRSATRSSRSVWGRRTRSSFSTAG